MSKFRSIPYAVLSGALLASGGAYAQSMSGIDQRQDYQQNRIEQGIRSGQITRSEAYRLEQGERAIDRAQARARADGTVTAQERARIDHMTDRQGQQIYRQSHDSQQSWDRGQNWGRTDGRRDGWNDRYAGRDGWGSHGSDHGQHTGWTRGEHNGWDGNRPPGIERRDARQDQRIHDGVRDGSLTRGEANRLEHGQDRINRYEARARSDGVVTPHERGRIDQMQNRESRGIHDARHNERTQPATPATPATTPTSGTQPPRNGGHGGWTRPQAGTTPPATQPAQQPSRNGGNGSGFRMQQASATPATPRAAFTPTSNPTGSRSRGR